jgi:hypothetical protein
MCYQDIAGYFNEAMFYTGSINTCQIRTYQSFKRAYPVDAPMQLG